ncbi:uncharacterized protein DC041_0010999, partial [Schistosoma bovis]
IYTEEAIFAATWLGYFNACLNSLVYSLLNNNFRMSCAKLLCAWHYNRERRQQYGLNQLKHFGDTPIQLVLFVFHGINYEYICTVVI